MEKGQLVATELKTNTTTFHYVRSIPAMIEEFDVGTVVPEFIRAIDGTPRRLPRRFFRARALRAPGEPGQLTEATVDATSFPNCRDFGRGPSPAPFRQRTRPGSGDDDRVGTFS